MEFEKKADGPGANRGELYQVQPHAFPIETMNEMAGATVVWDHGSRPSRHND
jgi:hypothetical protein